MLLPVLLQQILLLSSLLDVHALLLVCLVMLLVIVGFDSSLLLNNEQHQSSHVLVLLTNSVLVLLHGTRQQLINTAHDAATAINMLVGSSRSPLLVPVAIAKAATIIKSRADGEREESKEEVKSLAVVVRR